MKRKFKGGVGIFVRKDTPYVVGAHFGLFLLFQTLFFKKSEIRPLFLELQVLLMRKKNVKLRKMYI